MARNVEIKARVASIEPLLPLARVLIKRAANDSGNVAELMHKLAEQIDREPERKAFLDALR